MWILLSGEVTTGRVCEYIVISVEFAQTCSLNLMLRWDGIYLIGFGSDVRRRPDGGTSTINCPQ